MFFIKETVYGCYFDWYPRRKSFRDIALDQAGFTLSCMIAELIALSFFMSDLVLWLLYVFSSICNVSIVTCFQLCDHRVSSKMKYVLGRK